MRSLIVLLAVALAGCSSSPSSSTHDDQGGVGGAAGAGGAGGGGGSGGAGGGGGSRPDGGDARQDAGSDAPIPACATDLTPFLATLNVPGISASVVKNGRVACTAVAGVADTTKGTPVTPDTDFLWASVSKTVTATALMQLYEQGKFKLDDDVGASLGFSARAPGCPDTPITFRLLLTHTSSITDNDTIINGYPVAVPMGDPIVSLADLVKGYLTPGGAYYDANANFNAGCPGTVADYSNMGIATVGYLVELLSGEDLYAYFRDHVFAPLGLKNTSFRLADLDRSLIAAPNGNGAQYGEADFPDGMLRTSPAQLGKFLAMIMEGGTYQGAQVLKPATVAEMLKQQTTVGQASTGDIAQGLVWYEVNTFGPVTWGHDGDDDGAASNMFFDPATHTGVLMVANGTWPDDPGASDAMKALFAEAAKY